MKFHLNLIILLSYTLLSSQTNYIKFVNPFIGTGGHGHTFPGSVLPFGMVQLSPDTRADNSWDGCSGYHYSDSLIYGFSHTHLSGTGCSDWADILIMPTIGEPSVDNKQYASAFSHQEEKASPGFYEVNLKKHGIKAELTSTQRVGIHRYTFPKTTEANIILDLLHRDKTIDCGIFVIDSVTIIGYRTSEAWAKKQFIHFCIKFSKPFKSVQFANEKIFRKRFGKFRERPEGAAFRFDLSDGQPLLVKVAISPVDMDGAKNNMNFEAKGWDFNTYRKQAEETWNTQLSKVEVNSSDAQKMTVFYTALYHCFIHPSLNMDADLRFRTPINTIDTARVFANYTVFSLWDTYRALNPLFTILETQRTNHFIGTLLNQYKYNGRLPVWELSGNETDCMIGFHAASVITDAMKKGIAEFDKDLAYEAMKASSNYTGFGIPDFNKNGYLQIDDESESVSKTLEYGYDNWCVSQVAGLLNKPGEAKVFLKRSLAYKNLFDPATGCMRPRKNGNWLSPFQPAEINNHFTEGNSWQYSFYAPHDIAGLIKIHGGIAAFEKKLDELFNTVEKNEGRDQADVTGLIGQYAHGNEPSHHMAYLYSVIGKPQKTIDRVRWIRDHFYTNSPDGLIGNEDCGQMSAWYIFSAFGMYPVCPGSNIYYLGEPAFESIKIHGDRGQITNIVASPEKSKPVTAIALDGEMRSASFITHELFKTGGTLQFYYDQQNKPYGSETSIPAVEGVDVVPAPLIRSASQVFKDKLEISMSAGSGQNSGIYYSLDGSTPNKGSLLYKKPFGIRNNQVIRAIAYDKKDSSSITTASLYKIKYDYHIQILSKANVQYASEGSQTMIDGIIAGVNWRKGNWLGYQGQNFECIIDLKKEKTLESFSLNFLQDSRSWIVFPTSVSFYISSDNKNFTLVDSVTTTTGIADYAVKVQTFSNKAGKPVKARYVKIVARNPGKLPPWHQGAGGESFLFVDELEIK
ncbi:MAG: GH92 family glycosyl hydrolase [Bacteroidia bacterium]|nr:GH92 family glycosyl hydrolase [Bacteroidia bacterium]